MFFNLLSRSNRLFPSLVRFTEGKGSTESSGSGSRDDFAEILSAGRSRRAESSGKDSELSQSLPLGSRAETPATSSGT